MSTWKIFSGAGNNYRWEATSRDIKTRPEVGPRDIGAQSHVQVHNSSSRLPSMADLLLQGCSKLLEDSDEGFDKTPMFKTGLGRTVPVKQSSIAKALSVLGQDDSTDTGQVQARNSECDFSKSLFQTGSGKMVNISSDGLARAKTLLRLVEDNDPGNFQGFQGSRKLSNTDSPSGWQNVSHLETREVANGYGNMDGDSVLSSSSSCRTDLGQAVLRNEAKPHLTPSRMYNSVTKVPPVRFQTAGGRSISVSSDALQRARSLLGDPELGTFLDIGDAVNSDFSLSKNRRLVDTLVNEENDPQTTLTHQKMAMSNFMPKSFVSPLRSFSKQMQSSVNSESIDSGTNLIKQFDAVSHDSVCKLNRNLTCQQEPLRNGLCSTNTVVDNSSANSIGLRKNLVGKSPGRQLVDISNTVGTASANDRQATNEKRRILRTSKSPFKRPRSSKFSTPMKSNAALAPNGLSTFYSEHSCSKGRVSSRYPFQKKRLYVREYFGEPPEHNLLTSSSDQFRRIRADNAENFTFPDDSGVRCIGAEVFFHMLIRSGALEQYASKEWVKNHYKWIIWKLGCYERCYPTKSSGKILTISNVLEELKYRYEREVNHGHRSAIKRILEGDASPTSMMVLCISAINSNYDPKIEVTSLGLGDAENHTVAAAKVELTDGWYSVDALLDVMLLKQLNAGKLFNGQKLRIWGAGLCGWVGPVSPLEVPRTANLGLHINGTYRAQWADRLGFCKGLGTPLAFKCIKTNGGQVPLTLFGITRIYPVLYKERLHNGSSIVRSERMENKVVQSYNRRRSIIVESIVSDFQRGIKHSHAYNDTESEEGAKILKVLETASQPEVLLAEMSPDQLSSFAKYQAKMEAIRHSDMEKSIEKALENAGLGKREVNPFMRVRVVGLTSRTYQRKDSPKEGLITIWNPTEKQQAELVEGKAYKVAGLLPTNTDADTIYLQARGSTTWQPLSLLELEHFKPFFTPRKSVVLSNLGEVPLSSEFDIAAFVVLVGEVYKGAQQMKQWVFVTDRSISDLQSEEFSDCLLAICFCSPYIDDDSSIPFNRNLAGSTVGFCNLIKRAKDQVNHLWVAEASENSTYFLSFDTPPCSHLKDAAVSAERWGKTSELITDKLREKVSFIIGDHNG
ncbi:Breast cancer type 2 susceptibility protein [Parasponia andersonii]|uniref:Breast cancer type 2 susceptibility protein n=1 Tax=Parasponia andersonii TaxID=3476 RepID=A0A2P5B0Z9_PARAD|nr:Breast cancer type 2 susceptibility protein [Parasponia andersonii]